MKYNPKKIGCLSLEFHLCDEIDMPKGIDDIVRVSKPPGIDMSSVTIMSEDKVSLLLEHMDGHYINTADILHVEVKLSPDGNISYSKPKQLDSNIKMPIQTAISKLNIDGTDYIYFLKAEHLYRKPAIPMRAEWSEGKLINVEEISIQYPVRINGWPLWYKIKDNRIAMVYRAKRSELFISFSDDGVNFSTPVELGVTGAMHSLGQFLDGTLAYIFQSGSSINAMQTFFKLSNDSGVNWSDKVAIVTNSNNVHDVSSIQRKDGNLDLYYVHNTKKTKESLLLFRRCLSSEGQLSKEQLVIQPEVGNIAKPVPHRLDDGRILLTFVEQGVDVMKGDHSLHFTILNQDSLCELK